MAKPSKRPKDQPDKLPKISKFADDGPALPTGQSSIEIIKDTDGRDLKTAAEDANEELASMVAHPGDTPEPAAGEPDNLADPKAGDTPLSDDIVEEIEAEAATDVAEETEAAASDETPRPEAPAEADPPAEVQTEEDGLPDDPVTNRAVEEIIAEEGDAVLAAEDKKLEETAEPHLKQEPAKQPGRLRRFWANRAARWVVLGGTAFVLLLVALVPHSRYLVLNTAGVRSGLELSVIDQQTLQPLKNVSVTAGGASGQTDSEGVVKLTGVRLGSTRLQIEKRAFAKIDKNIVIGWGSNPLGEFKAEAVGAQYTFLIKDFLSGKPIDGAEAASGDGNASSDTDGKIVLTLDTADQEDTAQINVDITRGGYRKETINLTVNNKEAQAVELVPARKHTFVSKRSGKYDVYTVDVDGKNEHKLVAGTGLEREDIALIPHGRNAVAALVSTRENVRNASGYLLSTLYIVRTDNGELTKIDQSEKIQVIGWSKEGRLVYVKVAAGASAIDPKRHRLMSFNTDNFADTRELAASNAFNDVLMAGDQVFYAPSNAFTEETKPGVYVVDAGGGNQKTLLDKEAFTLQRSSYDVIDMNVGEDWYSYSLRTKEAPKQSQPAVAGVSRLYTDNPSNDFSLWTDDRDGRGVLLAYDRKSGEDKQLVSRSGLRTPLYWLNDNVAVFRVKDSRETADYVISTDGGDARKITDVTDSAGLGRWYYY